MWNGYPNKMLRGTEVEINDKKIKITSNLRKFFTQTSNIPLKKLNEQEWEIYKKFLETLDFANYKPKSGESKFGRYKYSETNLKGRGIEKFIIPSNVIDIYARLELLPGLKLSDNTDNLTEASNSIDELYKRSEFQIEQPYRNARNKFSTQ